MIMISDHKWNLKCNAYRAQTVPVRAHMYHFSSSTHGAVYRKSGLSLFCFLIRSRIVVYH